MPPSPQGEGRGRRPMVVPTRKARIFPPRRARSPDRAVPSPTLPLAVVLRRLRRRRISTAPGGIYRSTRRYQPCAGGEILRAAQDDTSSGIRLAGDRRLPPSPRGEGRGRRPMVVPTGKARIFPPRRARSPDRAVPSPPLPLAVILRRLRRRRISKAPGGIYRSTRRYQPCAGARSFALLRMTPHPASASREIGGCHLLLKDKA